MAAKKRKKAKTTGTKKARSPAQKAATKAMLAARARKDGGKKKGKKARKIPKGGLTKRGYPKHLLIEHAQKIGVALRENNMGSVLIAK